MPDSYVDYMPASRKEIDLDQTTIIALFARLDNVAFGAAMGAVFGLGLFLVTAILLIQGAPPGVSIGPNLSALITFLPGYEMSWFGAAIGGFYGLVYGFGVGFLITVFWNLAHLLFVGSAVLRGDWLQ